MKNLKKLIKLFGLSFLFISTCLILYACASVPKLSKEEKQIITNVVRAPIPEIIKGKTGFVNSQGHNIWYESIAPNGILKGSVILIMGNGNDALTWQSSFISPLTKNGYQVIRFDHRGTGLSTSEKKCKKKNAYTLNDMASDVIAILDNLKIKKAHIVGASMGGMIAQIVAIENPERTATLTSIMSSADVMDAELSPMSNEIVPKMIGSIIKHGFFGSKKGQIKRQIVQKKILMGAASGIIPVKKMAETSLYNLEKRDGYKLMSARHHYEAILNSTSRLKALQELTKPILVIHGMKDPVIPISHAKKMANTIVNADRLWVKNMGHDLPEAAIQEITAKMLSNFKNGNNK